MEIKEINVFHQGDCADLLNNTELFPDNSIDLIITSPPYADKRKKELGYVS